jgi:glycerol-3-phosphate acyltransferase PlsX
LVSGLRVILFGPAAEIGDVPEHVSVVDAPVSIAKDPDPARAVRRERESSIVKAVEAITAGGADALVSGGSTGAALAASLFGFKRARGVHRPALAILVPVPGAPFLLLDAGANVEVRPEHLVQFAHMGAAFMEAVGGVSSPRVALLANGTEPTKGTEIVVAAHQTLASSAGLNFVGNVEGFAIGTGEADVIVADGFTGNVALKVMEGASAALLGAVRTAAMSSARSKLGGALLRPALRGLRSEIDPEEQGGAVLLGLRRLAVVPHGSFTARGFARAIEVAARGVREDVAGRTHERLAAAGALRAASGAVASVPDQP